MKRASPCPERTSRIVALYRGGKSPRQIAAIESCTLSTVQTYISLARSAGDLPRSPRRSDLPSRLRTIISMIEQGATIADILAALPDERPTSVKTTYHDVRRAQHYGVFLPLDVADALRPHANARGCGVGDIARELVEAAIDQNLIEQLLDDGVSPNDE